MKMTAREVLLLLVTLVAALFGATVLLARPKVREWREMTAEIEQMEDEIARAQSLIATREKWQARLRELSKHLPHFGQNVRMDTRWLSTVEAIAARNGVQILQRQAGEERRMGDVFELPIECKDWEADLDSLVHFMYELQSQGALDIRHLLVKPKGAGKLRGRFSLTCAYTKESDEEI